ncbi:MAG: ThiF family adenylyltransferase, partial [Acidimicrobiia bacterium]|nr:ThiF family adenylyltransferase [Acidimicrobiia bacterium]
MVVRLPGPAFFKRLRTDRNRNKLTTLEQEALGEKTVAVVGLSVGHVIAHTLASEGVGGRIKLADNDNLELTNLNRIPATVLDLGLNKAIVAARRLLELDPYLELEIFSGGVDAVNLEQFLDGVDVVIEECDSFDIKIAVRAAARDAGVPVVMHTSDRGLLDVERFDLEPDRPLLHGLVGDLTPDVVSGLTTEEKVPYVVGILGSSEVSTRLAASLVEIDHQVTSWPQLAEDV